MPVCDLDCGKGFAHEFIGPVRIVMVDDDEYYRKIFKMGLIMFVYVLMGMLLAVPAVYFLDFTVHFANILHVLIGTITCQCLIPIGVLLHNPLVLSTAPMRPAERLLEHIILQAVSCFLLFCTFVAAFCIKQSLGKSLNHIVAGQFTVYFCVSNTILGGFIRFWNWDDRGLRWKPLCIDFHKVFGILTVFLGGMTYTSGLTTMRFEDHLPTRVQDSFTGIVQLLALIYTVIIIYYPLAKFFQEKDFNRPTIL